MNINKRLAVAGTIIGSSIGLLAGPAALAASAATSSPASAPSCVNYTDSDFATAVTNNCGDTQNVQVIIDWGPDSGCVSLAPTQTWLYHYWPGTFNRVQSC